MFCAFSRRRDLNNKKPRRSQTVEHLREGDAKSNAGDDSHVAVDDRRHQLITTLQTHVHSVIQSHLFLQTCVLRSCASTSRHRFIFQNMHTCVSHLFVDFACCPSRVLQVGLATVGETDAAARRNAGGCDGAAAQPAGEVINSTAVKLQTRC